MTAALRCTGLSRSFGALAAVDGVDLVVAPGARHALIGPNGAGKSTLFKLVSGTMRAQAGSVELAGRDVTGLSEVRRCRLGMSQTMQHSSLFASMTAAETLALAVQRHDGSSISPLPRRGTQALRGSVEDLLADVGLAGMSAAESARLVELLAALPPEITVLLVEHDLDLVFSVADAVTVLHLGRVLLSGTPDEVRASAAVREAYLGTGRREELFLS